MKKKNKIIGLFVLLISIFCLSTIKVDAATTGTVSMTASASKIVVGNTVTITVKVSSSKALGTFAYNVSYDSSYLSLTSGSSSGLYYTSNGTSKSTSYTLKFKALKSGSATVKFNVTDAYDIDENSMSVSSGSKSITIITQAELEASYSSNNNLSSLSVSGYDLSPTFSSSVTSYTVDLPANTETITVSATKSDSTASVSGTGEIEVVDGVNTIKVVVTAQNGSTKTYTITANVEELDPIKVTVDNTEYTLVRKDKLLESPSSEFTETTITIDDEEIPALYNENADLTLVGLKGDDGNVTLYIYNSEDNSYTKYNQHTFDSISLYILDKEVESDDVTTITLDEEEYTAYTFEDDEFYYFYAINLSTGKENLYRYDKEENTVQRCTITDDGEIIIGSNNDDELNLYKYIILGLIAFIFITYIIILLSLIFKKSDKKKKKKDIEEHIDDITPGELTDEEKEIDNEIERIGTQELELNNKSKVTDEEKEKLIKNTTEELKRINNNEEGNNNNVTEVINEVLEENKKKKKGKSKKKNKSS